MVFACLINPTHASCMIGTYTAGSELMRLPLKPAFLKLLKNNAMTGHW